jgi:RHS repeat-associated protein
VTKYTYDPLTFRLQTMVSRKEDGTVLQDLRYTYDPAGNITQIHDGAFESVFNHNQRIDPTGRYEYDPVYRLVEAKGREHEGMTACHYRQGDKKQTEFILLDLTQPINNGQALRNYTEHYTYDASGNLRQIRHIAGSNGSWTRNQEYEVDDPLLPPEQQQPVSNRLRKSDAGCLGEDIFIYIHDANGNITKMPHLQALIWDYADQLRQVELNTVTNGTNDRTYYLYDASGQRVRKVIERGGERKEEHIYLGGFEIYRKYNRTGLTLERQTLHIMDDQRRIALVETRTDLGQPARRFRYQMDDHLGSSLLEVDESAREISREEYYPYGGTAFLASESETEVKLKRYRYSGKERDDETGLCFYEARYYAPWLGRWCNIDPLGPKDSINLFVFVLGNPLVFVDREGKDVYLFLWAPGLTPRHPYGHAAIAVTQYQENNKSNRPTDSLKVYSWRPANEPAGERQQAWGKMETEMITLREILSFEDVRGPIRTPIGTTEYRGKMERPADAIIRVDTDWYFDRAYMDRMKSKLLHMEASRSLIYGAFDNNCVDMLDLESLGAREYNETVSAAFGLIEETLSTPNAAYREFEGLIPKPRTFTIEIVRDPGWKSRIPMSAARDLDIADELRPHSQETQTSDQDSQPPSD